MKLLFVSSSPASSKFVESNEAETNAEGLAHQFGRVYVCKVVAVVEAFKQIKIRAPSSTEGDTE